MLKEIQSRAFVSNHTIRPKIVFNNGLNVVNGSESGTNSIGKSTFLMAIDFCFGGDDYVEKLKNVVRHVGDHEIDFAFEFKNQKFYFSRSTSNPDIITICDANYNKTNETWSKNEFVKWLNTSYSNPTSLSFRQMVSLYLRIYNRENLNEMLPLRSFNNQTEGQSIETLLKLYDLFGPITDSSKAAKEADEKKSAFAKAQEYDFIPKITKTQYNQNLKRIEELEESKKELASKSEKGLLELTADQAEMIGKLKEQLSVFRRQRSKLYNQIDVYKKDKVDNKESLTKDFEELKNFFPEIDTKKLSDIEDFHKDISAIMMAQVKESEKKTWNLINLLNGQIADIERKITEISQIKHVSVVTLEKYSGIDKDIERLKLENEKFLKVDELGEESKKTSKKLTDDTMVQAAILEKTLNDKMTEINSVIFNGVENTPHFHIKSPKSYEFYTPEDDGTGTNFKGLVVMDISTLLTTALPVLVHDSVLLKQISNESIEKIFEIYNRSEKQIFVSIDKDTSYTADTAALIRRCEVLKLASGGNELFGFHFGKKGE